MNIMGKEYFSKAIITILEQITSTRSRNEKIKLLKTINNSEAEDIQNEARAVFAWTYSPLHDFYVKDLNDLPAPTEPTRRHWTDTLKKLSEREVTGNDAKQLIANQLANYDTEEECELFKKIIRRDLRAGISAKTINRAFPDLIYEHPYMRCDTLSEKNLERIGFPVISQLKLDGMYIDIKVDDGKVTYMSRKGSILPFNDPVRDAELINIADGYVIQGEAIVIGGEVEQEEKTVEQMMLDRASGNGYLNSDDIDLDKVIFIAWDVIPVTEFAGGNSYTKPYIERLAKIEKITHLAGDWLRLVETKMCDDLEAVREHFKAVRREAQEGTVIKNPKGIWKDGTSKDQLKYKVIAENDFVITGYNEGEGKYEGQVGSVIVESRDGDIVTAVSGFTDAMRLEITENIDALIESGTIMTVKHNDILTSEQTDKLALFLPRFVKLRADKSGKENADTLEDVNKALTNFS